MKAERDTLRLALYDLTCSTRTPFGETVKVSLSEIEASCGDDTYLLVSVSRRAMPIFLIKAMDGEKVSNVEVLTETQIMDNRENCGTFWRAVREAIWKQNRLAA